MNASVACPDFSVAVLALFAACRAKDKRGVNRTLLDLGPHVSEFVASYHCPAFARPQLEQAALLALMRAVEGFNPDRGVPLEHYSRRCMKNAVVAELVSVREERRKSGMGKVVEEAIQNRRRSQSIEVFRDEAREVIRNRLASWIARRTPRQRLLIDLRFFRGFQQAEIANSLKVSRAAVTQTLKLALEEGRRELGDLVIYMDEID